MSALATRAHVEATHNAYLTPLAHIGQVPEALHGWVEAALKGKVKLHTVYDMPADDDDDDDDDGKPKPKVLGRGYELVREQRTQYEAPEPGLIVTGADVGATTVEVRWQERVLVVRSQEYADAQERGLNRRLTHALDELHALTPPPGRGRRQFTESGPLRGHEARLQAEALAILKRQRVDGLITLTYKLEFTRTPKRAYAGQPAYIQENRRYVLQARRNTPALRTHIQHFGWRAYVTNASSRELSLSIAIQVYRDEFLIERNFARLKGRSLALSPLCLKREDHVMAPQRATFGLTRLLTLAARVLSVVEFQARRKLQSLSTPQGGKRTLSGLVPGQSKRATAQPTAERLLKAFVETILTVTLISKRITQLTVTPLSTLQQDILHLLGCPSDLFLRTTDLSVFPLRI